MAENKSLSPLCITLLTFISVGCGSTPQGSPKGDPSSSKYTTVYDAFSRYDTNGDNYLDPHEFHQFQLDPEIIAFRERVPEAARTIPILFEEIDEDGDTRISLDEITVIAEGHITKMKPKQ